MKKYLTVKDDIYWIGALDFDIKTFDIVMHTDYGTTYNSYVVKGSEKIAVIEANKGKFFDEYLERLKSIVDPKNIDYLIVNHTEPDHTGAISDLLDINPDIIIVGSAFAIRFLGDIINKDFKSQIVKENNEISLGNKTLSFLSVPFLHWPDTMYTYIKEDKTLFSCDSFGCHYCNETVFNDKIDDDFYDAYKYYFDCIMGPFKGFVKNALAKIANLEIDTICPGHGPVLRQDIPKYIAYYEKWSENQKNDDIVIAYVSSYGYTKKLAEQVAIGVKSAGLTPKLYDLETANKDDVLDNIATAKGLLIGTPTIADDTLPNVWHILIALNANLHKGLYAGVFGSYGWNGNGIVNVESRFKNLKFKMPVEALKIPLNPSNEQQNQAINFGKEFVNNIIA